MDRYLRIKSVFGLFFLVAAVVCLAAAPVSAEERGKAKGGVTFNFVDVELSSVAKFVSDVTGRNFIFDERVRGKITIIAPSPLSTEDAFNLFSSVLEIKGFTLLPSGVDAYKIVPATEARQSGMAVSKDGPSVNENYIVRLVSLKHISSDDALRFLQPVVSKTGHISSFGPGNLLLVVDKGLNVDKVLNILEGIDRPPLAEDPEVVFLTHASSEDVASVLNQGMQKQARKGVQQQARAVADKRLNAVVIFGSRGLKDAMRRLIKQLDVPTEEAQSTINVYFLENADAEELAEVLQRLMKVDVKDKKQPARSPFEAVKGISITPDKATNSLLIVASPADYRSIVKVIEHLDIKRRQVYVEAMIVEASIDKLRDIGAKWRATAKHNGSPVAIGGVGTVDFTTIQQILTGLTGLSVGGIGTNLTVPVTQPDGTLTELSVPGFAALFSLSEFEGSVNVLSTPQILTSDNSEAEIHVGQNVPFISQRERDVTTTNTVLNSIERKDVGITLRITPQITEGNSVKMDIYQEISAVVESSEEVFTAVGPPTTKRATKTTVVVEDEQTVVIGGLMQELQEKTETRVPLLHRIPLLGWFFKFRTTTKEKTNLLVFLTPHIIKDAEGLNEITGKKTEDFARSEELYVKDELLVKFKAGVTDEQARDIIADENAMVIKYFEKLGVYRIRLRSGWEVKKGLDVFLSIPEVEYAEPNFILNIQNGNGSLIRSTQ
jgi:general secretion pathway protein D